MVHITKNAFAYYAYAILTLTSVMASFVSSIDEPSGYQNVENVFDYPSAANSVPSPITLRIPNTAKPSDHEVMKTTAYPTSTLTTYPTSYPTTYPTSSPTAPPTTPPPTPSPTPWRPTHWFNYNPDSDAGPDNWEDMETGIMSNNECDGKYQSPVDIEDDGGCRDDHTPGKGLGQTKFSELEFRVMPDGLRVSFPKRNNAPRANWSNLSGAVPLLHIDVKMKSEHYWDGTQYPAEFQMYYLRERDDDDTRYVILSILMDDSLDKENIQLEQFIREWEEVAWKHQSNCNRRKDPSAPSYYRTYVNVLSEREITDIWGITNHTKRADFDVYRFLTTGWYCGYKGSLTSPPCTEMVDWRILDVPMQMSRSQLERMQAVLTGRLDYSCNLATASFQGQVNRPLQRNKKTIWCCTTDDWEYKVGKDPLFWKNSWPDDYHGWDNFR